jgi:membrane-associated protein
MEVGGIPIGIYVVLFIVFAETGLFAGFCYTNVAFIFDLLKVRAQE